MINILEFYNLLDTKNKTDEKFERNLQTVENIRINYKKVNFKEKNYQYHIGVDLYYQIANVIFEDLSGISKYRKQMKEMIEHISSVNKSDTKSDSENDDVSINRKPKLKKINQMERVHNQPIFRIYKKVS